MAWRYKIVWLGDKVDYVSNDSTVPTPVIERKESASALPLGLLVRLEARI